MVNETSNTKPLVLLSWRFEFEEPGVDKQLESEVMSDRCAEQTKKRASWPHLNTQRNQRGGQETGSAAKLRGGPWHRQCGQMLRGPSIGGGKKTKILAFIF